MRTAVEKVEKNQVTLEIEVEAEKVDRALDRAYRKLAQRINIPGFRKGKAPRWIVENYVGKPAMVQEAVDELVPEAYADAVKEQKLEPIDTPKLEIVQAEVGQPLIFKASVEVKPEVKLGQYTDLVVKKALVDVSDQEVDARLEALRQRYAKLVAVEDRGAEMGDVVILDFEGTVDGEPVPGAKEENFPLTLGSKTLVEGFEEQLVGARPQESREVRITFPSDYRVESLQGKEVLFHTKVKEIKRKELSPLDDEFAKDVSEFETLEELRADVANSLKRTKEQRANEAVKEQAIKQAVDNAEVELPEVLVERQTESLMEELEEALKAQGLELDKYLEMNGGNAEELRDRYRQRAQRMVKADLVLEAIARKEDLVATDADLDHELEQMATSFQQEPEALKQKLDADQLERVKFNLTLRKVVDFLVEHSQIQEVKDGEAQAEEPEGEPEKEEPAETQAEEADQVTEKPAAEASAEAEAEAVTQAQEG